MYLYEVGILVSILWWSMVCVLILTNF